MGGGNASGDIAAQYSRRYAVAVTKLLGVEGGFVDDPADAGGATKYGISLRFLIAEGAIDADHNGFEDYDLNMDGDIDGADIRLLTMSDAVALYYRCFWDRYHLESFPDPLADVLLDQEVNDGAIGGNKLLQRAINSCSAHIAGVERLNVDGVLGEKTHDALDAVLEHPAMGMPALLEAYREAARARYRAIVAANPNDQKFLRGWLARADELGTDA
jgi:lysozyme family protein